jgi:hypothetical protein
VELLEGVDKLLICDHTGIHCKYQKEIKVFNCYVYKPSKPKIEFLPLIFSDK